MKVYRHIAILLLICFSVFLGHNLVPHHHHSEVLANPLPGQCPIQHADHHACDQDQQPEGKDHQSEDHPLHCHAFNDVVFEKHHSDLVKPLTCITLVTFTSFADLLSDPQSTREIYLREDLKIPDKTVELSGSRVLRGPPALV